MLLLILILIPFIYSHFLFSPTSPSIHTPFSLLFSDRTQEWIHINHDDLLTFTRFYFQKHSPSKEFNQDTIHVPREFPGTRAEVLEE